MVHEEKLRGVQVHCGLPIRVNSPQAQAARAAVSGASLQKKRGRDKDQHPVTFIGCTSSSMASHTDSPAETSNNTVHKKKMANAMP